MLHFIAIWHKVQHTIIRKLDYIAAGGIINMVNMVNTAVNNNIYAGRKSRLRKKVTVDVKGI